MFHNYFRLVQICKEYKWPETKQKIMILSTIFTTDHSVDVWESTQDKLQQPVSYAVYHSIHKYNGLFTLESTRWTTAKNYSFVRDWPILFCVYCKFIYMFVFVIIIKHTCCYVESISFFPHSKCSCLLSVLILSAKNSVTTNLFASILVCQP